MSDANTADVANSNSPKTEAELWEEKRERQERSRRAVQHQEQTQERQFFIAPELARQAKVKHRFLVETDD